MNLKDTTGLEVWIQNWILGLASRNGVAIVHWFGQEVEWFE